MIEVAPVSLVQFDKAQMLQALRTDPEFVIQYYMVGRLDKPVPEFHVEIFKEIIDLTHEYFALAVPRGYAKTTIAKLAIVWIYLFTDYRFIAYVSNTAKIAVREAKDIVELLKSDNHIAMFGEVKWIKQSDSDQHWEWEMSDPLRPGKIKRCILIALGSEQQVRGTNINHARPQLIVCDDAENENDTATVALREKFKNWVFGALFKAGAPKANKIWIGNVTSQYSLIDVFCNSEAWRSIKYGCLKSDGTPLWPEMFSIEDIKQDFKVHRESGMLHVWFAEMMNTPVPIGLGLLKIEDIQYRTPPIPSELLYCFAVVDPAISKKKSADHTGLVIYGYWRNRWQIVAAIKGKWKEEEFFYELREQMMYWHFRIIGMEADGMQHAYLSYLLLKFQSEGITDIEFIPLSHGMESKFPRIRSLISLLKGPDHWITISEDDVELTMQLLRFDPAKDNGDDDVADAAAYGPRMIAEHAHAIMYQPSTAIPLIQGELEVSEI